MNKRDFEIDLCYGIANISCSRHNLLSVSISQAVQLWWLSTVINCGCNV